MVKLKVWVVVGIVCLNSDLSAYEMIVVCRGKKFVSPRRRVTPESWGEFLDFVGGWLDQQTIDLVGGNLANHDLRFVFRNGSDTLTPVSGEQYEVFKWTVEENLRSRLLEGRLKR
jgi:hypothetical protein